tara:strand:- start:303 stop:485 length:183 start_codon:yes stop_codon:yes gene_type:complete
VAVQVVVALLPLLRPKAVRQELLVKVLLAATETVKMVKVVAAEAAQVKLVLQALLQTQGP